MAKQTIAKIHLAKPKVKKPGVHAKSGTSRIKGTKNYKKPNVGQG